MTFPLRLRVSIAPGADLTADPATWPWTDITAYVRPRISINRGRPDESGQTPPGSCKIRADNAGGRFVARNPMGPWYPLLRRNCPLRTEAQVGGVWYTRSTTYIDELPVTFVAGSDDTYVDIVASGITRRLGQGMSLRSPQYRAISRSSPLAYWPLEDGEHATQAASPVIGVSPLSLISGSVKFAGTQGPDGSSALADFSSGGRMSAPVPAAAVSTSWRIEFDTLFSQFEPGAFAAALQWRTAGGVALWEIDAAQAADGGLSVQWETAAGGFDGLYSNTTIDDGQWHHIRVDASQSGGNIAVTVQVDGAVVISGSVPSVAMGAVSWLTINPTGEPSEQVPSIGHIAIWSPYSSSVDTLAAFRGHAGEVAPVRIARLCEEERVPCSVAGVLGEPMGPQPVGNLLTLLRDAEKADGGILYEMIDGRLGYLPRENRYNQTPALALTRGQLSGQLLPADDDRFVRNDVTVNRTGGSWAQASDPTHIAQQGRYDDDVTVNTLTDGALPNHAGWLVHLGTTDALRFPQLTVNFRNPRVTSAVIAAWLATDIGSRVTVSNPPPELALERIDQLVEGYAETLDRFEWSTVLHCSPAAGWDVATADGVQRVAADGSTLGADITSTALSLSLTSTAANGAWTTDATDFPLDLRVGGERVTAAAITGAGLTQTVTLSARGVNGIRRTWAAGTEVDVWEPAYVPL